METDGSAYLVGLLVGLLIYGVFFAWVCQEVAGRKGLDRTLWGCLGFLFGVFGLVGVAVMPADHARGGEKHG